MTEPLDLKNLHAYRVRPSCGGYVVQRGRYTPDEADNLTIETMAWFKEYGEADAERHRLETGG